MKKKIVSVETQSDVALAAFEAKGLSKQIGFSLPNQLMISTAVSELAQNIINYAEEGTVYLTPLMCNNKKGIEIIARDNGPGIMDIKKAMNDYYSTGGTMGVGLPGAKRLMDEFEIKSSINEGTEVRAQKWI